MMNKFFDMLNIHRIHKNKKLQMSFKSGKNKYLTAYFTHLPCIYDLVLKEEFMK